MVSYTIMIIEVKNREILSDLLRRTGRGMKSDCTLHKGCGKCRVKLLSGLWESEGKLLPAPATAVACITRLKSCIGTIEIPDEQTSPPQSAETWSNVPALPRLAEAVIAVDMGTTTIAAARIENGSIVKSASAFNNQISFGDNVMSRIANSKENFSALRSALLETIKKLLEELDYQNVERIGIAGNTVMNCFLHGISPFSIGFYPFKAPQLLFPERRDLWGEKSVVTLPSLTGLLGGDITAGLYESQLEVGEMLIDLGTNCEIIFLSSAGLFGTSAAAGPAFEGAGISCGSRAPPGAIDHYCSDGRISVIGGIKPYGLCGSALVDFLAVERARGNLDRFGRFTSGAKCFEIAPGISVNEEDIAELLKAKAAVYAAVKTLEQYCGEPLRRLKIAGGFARYLDPESARKIGLLPPCPALICGNLSLAGAAHCAVTPGVLEEMSGLSKKIREIHLNECPGFEANFTAGLLLL